MSRAAILGDLLKLLRDAQPLPNIQDRQAVKDWTAKVMPTLIDLAYDAGGFDQLKLAIEEASDSDLEAAIEQLHAADASEGKTAAWDGTILKQLIANLPQLIAFILAVMPK
jgi:hypothetical protein